jgi:hypothetical protein
MRVGLDRFYTRATLQLTGKLQIQAPVTSILFLT